MSVLAPASSADTNILTVDLDMAEIKKSRLGWPFLRDRRIDAYEDLTKRLID